MDRFAELQFCKVCLHETVIFDWDRNEINWRQRMKHTSAAYLCRLPKKKKTYMEWLRKEMFIPLSNVIYFTSHFILWYFFLMIFSLSGSVYSSSFFFVTTSLSPFCFLQPFFLSLLFVHNCLHRSTLAEISVFVSRSLFRSFYFTFESVCLSACVWVYRLQCELYFLFTAFNTRRQLTNATFQILFIHFEKTLKIFYSIFIDMWNR